MAVVDVKVKSIDDSARYLYPNRIVEIKTSGKSILTPTRVATSYEYHEKAKVPTDIPIRNPAFINIERLGFNKFQKLLTTNTYFSQLLRRLDMNNRIAQYADLRLTLLQPTVTQKTDPNTNEIIQPSPMNLLKEDKTLRDRFLRFVIRLQEEAGISPISIPFIELPFSSFREMLSGINRNFERSNQQPIFFVDPSYLDFEAAIDFIINELQAKVVGLIYRPYRNVPLSYEALFKYVDRDVAFLNTQVYRLDTQNRDISTMHYLPFLGNDLYSVMIPIPFGKSDKNATKIEGESIKPPKPPKDKLDYVKFFDRKSLQVNALSDEFSIISELRNQYEKDSIIENILEHYGEARTNEKIYTILTALSKVNELNSSFAEFNSFQKYVNDNSTKDYLQEKKVLQEALRKERQYSTGANTFNQSRLG